MISISKNVLFGFHRLCIVGDDEFGMQPFIQYHTINNEQYKFSLICNGEIYNYNHLIKTYQLQVTDNCSDCEILISLYIILCMKKENNLSVLINKLDGEFAFIMCVEKCVDIQKGDIIDKYKKLIICRDHVGVRPLFIGAKNNRLEGICISSEMKAIPNEYKNIDIIYPGTYKGLDKIYFKYYKDKYFYSPKNRLNYYDAIRRALEFTVANMLQSSEKKIGAFLSGGLDSSIIVSLLSKYIPNLNVFSVGIGNTDDIINAKKLIQFLNTKFNRNISHYILNITTDDIIKNIEDTIYKIESFDTTTVRASIPQNILAKWIKNKFDVNVLFSGEGADELFNGYLYSRNAPSDQKLGKDSARLVNELVFYDLLRTDRTVSGNGLEVRVPFLSKQVVKLALTIPASEKKTSEFIIEKRILRKSFMDILPKCIYLRRKEAFSDSVSSKKGNSVDSIKQYAETMYTDNDLNNAKYEHCPPRTKEELLYRHIFDKYYKGRERVIPDFWRLQWTDIIDPSATKLNTY